MRTPRRRRARARWQVCHAWSWWWRRDGGSPWTAIRASTVNLDVRTRIQPESAIGHQFGQFFVDVRSLTARPPGTQAAVVTGTGGSPCTTRNRKCVARDLPQRPGGAWDAAGRGERGVKPQDELRSERESPGVSQPSYRITHGTRSSSIDRGTSYVTSSSPVRLERHHGRQHV